MGNCLVTKLKESVNNDNLSYFDVVRLIYTKLDGFNYINLSIGAVQPFSGTVEILSNNGYLTDDSFANYGLTHTYSNESTVLISPSTPDAEVLVKINPKSAITGFYMSEGKGIFVNLMELDYCQNLNTLKVYNEIATADLGKLHLDSLSNINGVYVGGINNLAKFNLTGVYMDDFNTLTGDVVDYIALRRQLTPETTQMNARFGYQVKFNGTELIWANIDYIWDATSIIAKPNLADSHTAWTYHATAAQIAELEGQGYTVVQVD